MVTGESMPVGPDSNYKVYKTQGVAGSIESEEKRNRRRFGALWFAGSAGGEGLILYGLGSILKNGGHPASPSGFR